MSELSVKIVSLKGSYVQFGKTQGKELKNTPLLEQLKMLSSLNSHPNVQKGEQLLKQFSPNLLEEIEGLGKALGVEREMSLRFSGYDVIFPKMGCTTLVTNGAYIRNYDFSPMLYDARLVFTKPTDGYATVGFSQQILGRLDGMNEKGLVVGLHFVNNEERAEGFFATTIVRMVLEQCADVDEAIELITNIPHGYCYNYSITDRSGKGIIVEAAPNKQIISENDPLICTNHFISESLLSKNRNDLQLQGSIARKNYIESLLENNDKTINYYKAFNNEDSPLFSSYYDQFFGTLHTVIYDPKDLKVVVGIGKNSSPIEFSLKTYLKDELILPETITGWIEYEMLG